MLQADIKMQLTNKLIGRIADNDGSVNFFIASTLVTIPELVFSPSFDTRLHRLIYILDAENAYCHPDQ